MEKRELPFKKPLPPTIQKRPPARTLRQLMNAESQYNWPDGTVLYQRIEAPPSLRPGIKVSDISGIPTNLTDISTKLRYATTDEYRVIKDLPPETVKGYLNIRNAQTSAML